MKPEKKALQGIDQLLSEAGWIIQDASELNLGAALGVDVREFPLKAAALRIELLIILNMILCFIGL